MLHKCTHRLINACRIRACLQKMIYLTYVYFFFIVILNGFLFMCMTGQSVFCMNTHIHPQRTTNHLSPTAKVCQGTEKDPHSSARQPNVTNTNRNTWEENNSWRTCTPGCYTWAACHTVINKSVCTIQIFFAIWGLRRPENPTSAGHHWQILSSPASWTVTAVLSYSRVI